VYVLCEPGVALQAFSATEWEWDDEKCLNLIDIYKNTPILWDLKDKHYYKKRLKEDTRNRYCKLVKESPVAKYLNATANLSCTEIASLNVVLLLRILGPTRLIKYSKSVGFSRVKFL
jgi:hypothetical protein